MYFGTEVRVRQEHQTGLDTLFTANQGHPRADVEKIDQGRGAVHAGIDHTGSKRDILQQVMVNNNNSPISARLDDLSIEMLSCPFHHTPYGYVCYSCTRKMIPGRW